MVDVGVATLICVSAKSVNYCLYTIIVPLWAHLSTFMAEYKMSTSYNIEIKVVLARMSPSLVRDNKPSAITELVVIC